MLKASYDPKQNLVTIEFEGKIDVLQAERFYQDVQKVIPKHGKGFKLLSDFTLLEQIDADVQDSIKKTMDFFNQQGVSEIMRIVPTPEQDIGFNIMSAFHYSKKVKFLTLSSRDEAYELLEAKKANSSRSDGIRAANEKKKG